MRATPKVMTGYARCNACGYVAIKQVFGRKLRCPQCGRQDISINPEEEAQATLGDFEAVA